MDWFYENNVFKGADNEEFISSFVGFVYIITNKNDGRKYIGKKLFTFRKTKQVKGKKKKIKVSSDWEDYYGSSEELKRDVLLWGVSNFERKILRLCKTKAECSYYEAKLQFEYDVLLKPQEYYNSWISCRTRRDHLKNLHS